VALKNKVAVVQITAWVHRNAQVFLPWAYFCFG